MAVLGPSVSVNMNGHNNIHNQLTKSLERIIEDAYLSGELKLSGRKLKEFPKPVKYDLTDTVVADLSKNRFTELPDEVTTYVYLERLFLSQNVIRAVPDAVGGLQSLTYLDLSSNQLTELPREICQMPLLQVLLVCDNSLVSLPKDVGRMTSLAELDASANRLTQVPMTLGDCVGMRALNLSNNQLGLLPLQVTYLRLEHLDVSCNCISSLPLELRNMTSLVTLNLDNNPLVSPPTTVCMRGRVHIFKYLESAANKDILPSHRRDNDTRRAGAAKHSSYSAVTPTSTHAHAHHVAAGSATIDCLRHRPRPVVDSGYSTDGVDKRWCGDGGVECVAGGGDGGSGRSTPSTPSTLSPGAALSRALDLSADTTRGLRISPEGTFSNGDDKCKLAHQQTYRQYKEALRQQRQQDVYRSRTDQPSPDLDSSPQNHSPVHIQRSQSSPHSPVANGYTANSTPTLYSRTLSSNSSISSVSPNAPLTPSSPLLHSTPRRFQNLTNNQNGNTIDSSKPPDDIQNRRPVQKVVPSRNVSSLSNGNGLYIKPTSPTKSPSSVHYHGAAGACRVRREGEVTYAKGAWSKEVAADKLSFTMKREFDKQKEESDLLQQLRVIIESRLKMALPSDLAPALSDGVVLCHLANHVRARAVASVHVPSPAQPKLTMARCRRNVDNFLEACRKIGVEEENLCTADDVLCNHPEYRGEGGQPIALRSTLLALLASQKDLTHPCNIDPIACEHSDRTHRRVHCRYAEDRIVSNFNVHSTQSDYFLEEDEYETYDNNNTETTLNAHCTDDMCSIEDARGLAYYNYQTNKVHYVAPFVKNQVFRSDGFEIYDTDEVDNPSRISENDGDTSERYDKTKMILDIRNNLNKQLDDITIETNVDEERRFQLTMLCLGSFFLSVIVLYLYPL